MGWECWETLSDEYTLIPQDVWPRMDRRMRPHTPARTLIARVVLGTLGMLLLACPRAPALGPPLDLTQYTHRAWTTLEGLAGSTRSIVQTPDGYLWLGTEYG